MRCNAIHHGRPLIRLLPRSSNDHIWISDSFVADAFARFSNRVLVQHKRHGSSVPGPLEARKRGTKRRNTHLAHSHGAQSSGFLATLFGSPKQKSTARYEPPNLTTPKSAELPFTSIPPNHQSPDPPPPPDLDFQALEISSNKHEYDPFTSTDIQTDTRTHDPDPIIPEKPPSVDRGGQEEVPNLPFSREIELVDSDSISIVQDLENATSTTPYDVKSQTAKASELDDDLSPEEYAYKTGNWAVTYRVYIDSPINADMRIYFEHICESKYDSDHVQRMITRFKLRGPNETALLLAGYLCARSQIQNFVRRAAEASNKILIGHGVDEMHEMSTLMWVILQHNPYPVNGAWKAILMTAYQAWGAAAVLQIVQTIRSYRPFPGMIFHEKHTFIVEMLRQETLKLDTDPDPESAVRLCKLNKAFMFPHVFKKGLDTLPFRLIEDGRIGALEVMELVERKSLDKFLIWDYVDSRVRVSKHRVKYITKLAHAFSVAPNYTHSQAYRGVRRCYYFLQHRSAPVTPDFTRALVRAAIIRPLLAGRWVPNAKLLFVLRIVEGVEGTKTALSLEKLAYEWRQKLLQEAVEIYKQARLGGDVRVNTANDLVRYQRRVEEQEDQEDEQDAEATTEEGQLRITRERVWVTAKERAWDEYNYKFERLQSGQVFRSA